MMSGHREAGGALLWALWSLLLAFTLAMGGTAALLQLDRMNLQEKLDNVLKELDTALEERDKLREEKEEKTAELGDTLKERDRLQTALDERIVAYQECDENQNQWYKNFQQCAKNRDQWYENFQQCNEAYRLCR